MTHPENTTPANPVQVTELIEEAKDFTERMTGQPWACELVERLIDALTAAIGAGGQAVAYEWRKRDRVMKHEENWSYVDYHTGLKIAEYPDKYEVRPLYTHPSPSGQAVAWGFYYDDGSGWKHMVCLQKPTHWNGYPVKDIVPLYAHPVQPEWRDIETAPKDGTWVWLHIPGHGPARARWKDRMGWQSHHDGREITRATHWMPLPASPAKEARP